MNQLGWIDFSPTHRNKVMLVMDLFKEQGVIDELGLGTIRDTISDLLFPGTSTIQTRAKYFLLIPWILKDIESKGKFERFFSDLEESEISFVKSLYKNSPGNRGIIGATLRNKNPKRKPSSIYWNGLRTYKILNFKGSLSDYINHLRYHHKKQQTQRRQIAEADGNISGDDKDANHMDQQYLWCHLPEPPVNWKTNLTIELSGEEAKFLKERIIRSNSESLWTYTLNHISERAKAFSSISDFLLVEELPDTLRKLVMLAVDFNRIMQGALIRYNLLIQISRENGNVDDLQLHWEKYLKDMESFNWYLDKTKTLWDTCSFVPTPTKLFVESWIEVVQNGNYNQIKGDQLLKSRELKLKGIRRARLHDKSIAQKQQSLTGISISEDGNISYLNYRWNTVRTFLNDIQNGLANNVTAQ